MWRVIHLSNPIPSGSLVFNTCLDPCSLVTVLSSLCGKQLLCARPLGLSYGNDPDRSCQPWQCTGYLLPPAGIYFYCSIFTPSTKWLRIDCSNLFIQRWGGSVSHPKITLKSDYIQFLTPGTNVFFLQAPSQILCISVCARMCACFAVLVWNVWFCLHFCLCLF